MGSQGKAPSRTKSTAHSTKSRFSHQTPQQILNTGEAARGGKGNMTLVLEPKKKVQVQSILKKEPVRLCSSVNMDTRGTYWSLRYNASKREVGFGFRSKWEESGTSRDGRQGSWTESREDSQEDDGVKLKRRPVGQQLEPSQLLQPKQNWKAPQQNQLEQRIKSKRDLLNVHQEKKRCN